MQQGSCCANFLLTHLQGLSAACPVGDLPLSPERVANQWRDVVPRGKVVCWLRATASSRSGAPPSRSGPASHLRDDAVPDRRFRALRGDGAAWWTAFGQVVPVMGGDMAVSSGTAMWFFIVFAMIRVSLLPHSAAGRGVSMLTG
jgi:hypothetical protein